GRRSAACSRTARRSALRVADRPLLQCGSCPVWRLARGSWRLHLAGPAWRLRDRRSRSASHCPRDPPRPCSSERPRLARGADPLSRRRCAAACSARLPLASARLRARGGPRPVGLARARRGRGEVRGAAHPAPLMDRRLPSPRPAKLVLCVIDAMAPAMLERAVAAGAAPMLERLMQGGRYVPDCVAAFPSVTPVCAASIVTGLAQDEHRIPAMNWFHCEED